VVLFGALALHYGMIIYFTVAGTTTPYTAQLYIFMQEFGMAISCIWLWLALVLLLGPRSTVPTQLLKQALVIVTGNMWILYGMSNGETDAERAMINLVFLNLFKEFGRALIVSSAYHLAAGEVGGVTGRVDRAVVIVPLLAFQTLSK
jgi:hypothetical protein